MKFDSDADAWELEDAEERNRNAPDIYPIPDIAARKSCRTDDRVQLLFLFRGRDKHGAFIQSERLAVIVREVSPAGYSGILAAGPVCSDLLRIGDSISFEPRHVYKIQPQASPQ